MAGYTRQSTGSIINGSPITAPPLNSEFNQVAAAFNATSGHSHDGSTGNSPKINLTTSVSGYLPAVHGGIGGKNKLDATTTPIVTNDNSEGYAPGSLWENTTTGRVYICVGNSTGAAVWRELVQVTSGTAILPAATDTVDLGNNSTRFQDLFLSGGISASGNVAAGGTLNITGATALGSTLGVTGNTTLVNLAATGTTTITSIDLNSGAIDGTTIGTTAPAAGTFTTLNANTSLVAATADINGGTVDNATIGASTPSTGSFTTLGASGTSTLATVDINGGNIDGTVIGASSHTTGKFTTLQTTGAATLASADINGGTVDGATIGATTASSGAFTTVTSSGGITGALTGNVSGNVTGNVTGDVTGDVTGNLTGNVTAGSGTSTFTNVTVNGNLNMNAGTSATITNLTAPSADLDAATKKYVDDEISTLIGDAGAGLNTLGELADALNDDDDFSTTVTNSIATKLPKAGGTMTGTIAMSTNKITGVGDPTSAQDVATKVYTDTQRDTRVAKSGDTMSGALAMGSNKITGLGTPTAGTDATTKTYVDNILGSATVAATSATNAATSESNAATSATNASNSATAAAGSATSAAASYDDFDDRYLGAKSSAPTVDNDGDALVIGALYFNSTTNIMNVYGSGGWQSAGSAVNGTSDRQTYIVTQAGQTVFAATYDAGYIDVYLNGVKQLMGTDVTATNGTSVVFASGTAINDIVDIVAYGTFVLADHLTQTQSDARYVNLSGDTMTGNLSMGDNVKAIFGAGSDLEIYHHPTDGSFIVDNGTGNLKLKTNGAGVEILNSADLQLAYFNNSSGEAVLKHINAGVSTTRLNTTSTGVNITGTAVTDGLTVAGNVSVDGGTIKLDGNYPVGTQNVALGDAALDDGSLSGGFNTAIGRASLSNNTSGSYNSALGNGSLQGNETGAANTAVGYNALTSNTASYNVAVGHQALEDNTSGNYLTAVGQAALGNNTSGIRNSALGRIALGSTTTGNYNSAFGYGALNSNETQSNNTAMGYLALTTATANNNTAVGFESAKLTTTGHSNSALGFRSLHKNLTGNFNSAFGYEALYESSSASNNTAVGYQAGYSGTTAEGNTFIGRHAGYSVTSANGNTYIGNNAGGASTSGQNNTILGRFHGNQHGLDIRTSSNNIVLSDGDGNPRGYFHGGLTSPLWEFNNGGTNNQWLARFKNTTNSGSPYGLSINFTQVQPDNGNTSFITCADTGATRFIVNNQGDCQNHDNSYGAISDVKLKEQIEDASSQWQDIKDLTIRKYKMKTDIADKGDSNDLWRLGVVAQEVETAGMSGLVYETPDTDEDNNDLGTTTKAVKYSILYMKAVKALQEAMDRIETLEAKVTALETP